MKPKRVALMTASTALLALAPKCPICLFAYFGVFGVATSTAVAYRAWLPPLTALWLALTVGLMLVGRGGRRLWGGPLVGLAGSVAVWVGKFVLDQTALVYGGLAALAIAVVWHAWRIGRASGTECVECNEESFSLDHQVRQKHG